MHEYLFDVKLFAAIRVKAANEAEARDLMMRSIDANTANLGAWPNGDPVICEVSLDVVDHDDLVEIDGKAVRRRRGLTRRPCPNPNRNRPLAARFSATAEL